jgi:endonuclease/exonuclease/phosphatase family metal-dependent hydrolase
MNFINFFARHNIIALAAVRSLVGVEIESECGTFSVHTLHLDQISEETRMKQLAMVFDHMKSEGMLHKPHLIVGG